MRYILNYMAVMALWAVIAVVSGSIVTGFVMSVIIASLAKVCRF